MRQHRPRHGWRARARARQEPRASRLGAPAAVAGNSSRYSWVAVVMVSGWENIGTSSASAATSRMALITVAVGLLLVPPVPPGTRPSWRSGGPRPTRTVHTLLTQLPRAGFAPP